MTTLILGLVLFFAAHSFTMFRTARSRVVERLGVLPYRGLYSLLALVGFVLIVLGYGDAPRIALWTPPYWLRHVTMVLMLPVFVLLVAAYLPGHLKARVGNPMLIALKTWAFAHLLANGDLASVLLFGAFLAWAVIDLVAVKRGGRTPVVAAPRALYDVVAVIAGLALYAGFVSGLHRLVSGVPLIAP
jgi:uncharacterized membrane protein